MKVLYYFCILASILWIAKHRCSEFDEVYLTEEHVILERETGSHNLRFGIVHPDHEVYFTLTPQFTSLFHEDINGSSSSFEKHWHYLGENISVLVGSIDKKNIYSLISI